MKFDEIVDTRNESASKLQGSRRTAERGALLEGIVSCLAANDLIVASWLFGSLGRGMEDALSDLDIFVVVKDEAIDDLILNRRKEVEIVRKPIFVVEAPQNRPPGGAYLMSLYPGETGPHFVDRYWQSETQATLPSQTKLLFNKSSSLSKSTNPPTFSAQPTEPMNELDELNNSFRFCWAMLLIAAKYSARHPADKGNGMIAFAWRTQQELSRALTGDTATEAPAQPNSKEKLEILFQLANSLHRMIPSLVAKGGSPPDGIREQTQIYLDFISPCFVLEGEK